MSADWRDAFKGRRVLVTGHTGFKGVWLSAFLARLGADVVGVSRRPDSDLFVRAGNRDNTLYCDIRDGDATARAFSEWRPDVVFHLAAQALVRRAYAEPRETFEINAQGTVNVLEAVRHTPSVKAVVAVTTDKVYRELAERRAHVETDELGGQDPYSASKAAAELAVETYRQSYFLDDGPPLASARAGNVIGGGDWAEDRLIPDFVRAIRDGEAIVLRNPGHVRPWQHVLEPVRGYLMLAGRLLAGDRAFASGWNFGPSLADAISVGDLAERLIGLWGAGRVEMADQADAPHEDSYLSLDSSKAAAQLGWTPALGLDAALELTVEWYREFLADDSKAPDLLNRQIDAYLERFQVAPDTAT